MTPEPTCTVAPRPLAEPLPVYVCQKCQQTIPADRLQYKVVFRNHLPAYEPIHVPDDDPAGTCGPVHLFNLRRQGS